MSNKSEINKIIKSLTDLEKKQIPYATSLALNNTAEIAMKAMKHKIDKDFNVTASWNKVGGKFGVKKRKATKRNLEVEIYIPTSNTWIEDHQDGDIRTNQLIPTKEFSKLFPTLKTNRSIKKKATTLLSNKAKNRIFEAKAPSGVKAIFQRVKGKQDGVRRRKSAKTGRLLKARRVLRRDAIPLFIIKSSVKEKPTLEFYDTILRVFEKNISEEFSKALKYAIKTAK